MSATRAMRGAALNGTCGEKKFKKMPLGKSNSLLQGHVKWNQKELVIELKNHSC